MLFITISAGGQDCLVGLPRFIESQVRRPMYHRLRITMKMWPVIRPRIVWKLPPIMWNMR